MCMLGVNLDTVYRPAQDLPQLTVEIKMLKWSPEGEQWVLGWERHNLTCFAALCFTFHSQIGYTLQLMDVQMEKNKWRILAVKRMQAKDKKELRDWKGQMNEGKYLFFAVMIIRQLQIHSCLCSFASLLTTWGANSTYDQDVFLML